MRKRIACLMILTASLIVCGGAPDNDGAWADKPTEVAPAVDEGAESHPDTLLVTMYEVCAGSTVSIYNTFQWWRGHEATLDYPDRFEHHETSANGMWGGYYYYYSSRGRYYYRGGYGWTWPGGWWC